MESRIISLQNKISRDEIKSMADDSFGDMTKAVVDLANSLMAVGGELHSDEEKLLLESGSIQQNLWGINLYPVHEHPEWIEFDSMINIRPSQNNRSRSVEDEKIREQIIALVASLIK